PTVELPKLLEVFNDDSVNINMVFRDDKALRFFYKGNNPIITGLQGKNFPGQINFATLKQDPKTGLNTAYVYEQKQWTTEIYGTIGRDNGWKPMTPGDYNIEYGADDTAGQKTMTTMTVRIHGFNERQSPISGATVAVNNATNLSQAEKDQVLANFKAANANVLSSTDYKKGTEEGSISVANNGDVTITYRDRTTDTVTNNVKYGVEKTTEHFYAVSGEPLSNINPRSLVRTVGGASDFPSGTTFAWKQGQAPTMEAMKDGVNPRTATLTVTHPDKTTTDLTYKYTVYQKIETKTNNGVPGKFYAFKAVPGTDATVGGSYANNIGGYSSFYINNDAKVSPNPLPSGTTFAYEYQLNDNRSTPVRKQDGSPAFSSVWHTTADSATTHSTTYKAIATYPKGRLGDVTTANPALTSTVSFNYTVVDPVAKQEYVTTVGNTTPLNDIISNPSNAVKNSDSSVAIPTGTDYTWVSAPDASSPGIYKKEVKVTLPQGSTDKPRNATNVPVTIKVRPNPPQISTDQVTNTGGLPNKGITVTDALPGATVTLTIGGKQLPAKTADSSGRVTFTANELADSNGLLPTGNVTVKQSKEFPNPVTNRNETLESDVRSVEISK
ncbi:MAG: Rib/alpha-like domain-containing protein, partial [Streptococcus mitis]|nr:Rib/alpha-like domain-containing protein [Streptococcus mitis]